MTSMLASVSNTGALAAGAGCWSRDTCKYDEISLQARPAKQDTSLCAKGNFETCTYLRRQARWDVLTSPAILDKTWRSSRAGKVQLSSFHAGPASSMKF